MLRLQLVLLLLWYLLPQPAVDPQRPLQAKAAADAGDAAAQWAAHGEEAALCLRHGLQARLAEGVSAVEKPGDPLGTCVGQETHATLALLAQDHGGSRVGRTSPDSVVNDRCSWDVLCFFFLYIVSLNT